MAQKPNNNRAGIYQKFPEPNSRINYLERRAERELANLKPPKLETDESLKDFLNNHSSESELILKLLNIYLKYKKLERRRSPLKEVREAYNEIQDDLESKIGENEIIKLHSILTNCCDIETNSQVDELIAEKTRGGLVRRQRNRPIKIKELTTPNLSPRSYDLSF